jgi:hypothetical protein
VLKDFLLSKPKTFLTYGDVQVNLRQDLLHMPPLLPLGRSKIELLSNALNYIPMSSL